MSAFVAPGRVLVYWDGKLGPSWDYDEADPELALTTGKRYHHFEVWRSSSDVLMGGLIGTTRAEAYLDVHVRPRRRYWYTVVGCRTADDPGEVIRTIAVETPPSRVITASRGTVAPSKPDDVKATRIGSGNRIAIKPGGHAKAPVLAYLVYDDNADQPESVVWVDSWDVLSSATHDYWTDRTTDGKKGYVLRTIDEELNLSEPTDVVEPKGGLYASDRLREVVWLAGGDEPAVVAGKLDTGAWADGTLTDARFNAPAGMAFDADGLLYVADAFNHAIRTVDLDAGTVDTFSGSSVAAYWRDGAVADARYYYPQAAVPDEDGDVWVMDSWDMCVRLASGGSVSTLVGRPFGDGDGGGWSGGEDGTGVPPLIEITDITAGPTRTVTTATPHGFTSGDTVAVYGAIGETHDFDTSGAVVTVTGATTFTYVDDGTSHDHGWCFKRAGLVDYAQGACVVDGVLYFTQYGDVLRSCTKAGVLTTVAGLYYNPGDADGSGSTARLSDPWGIAEGPDGALYVCDAGNHTIRRVTTAGAVTTALGSSGVSGDTNGDEASALLNSPMAIAFDGDDCYIAENYFDGEGDETCRIRLWSGGTVSTWATGLSWCYGLAVAP